MATKVSIKGMEEILEKDKKALQEIVDQYNRALQKDSSQSVAQETAQSTVPTQTQPQTTTQKPAQTIVPQVTPVKPTNYAYDPNTNEAYLNALKALEQANKNAPTYGASYDQQLEELYDKIVNREDFSYDLNADALYEQYQQKFTALGDQAMQDTMGQAAALTGGYGSSYAQNAGQQAYNQYLTQLNDIVPDLYNQAYGRYQDEGQALLNQYGMLGDMAQDEYGKYMDAYNQWLTQLQMSREDVDTAYNRGYTDFVNSQQMAYQQNQADIAYQQWLEQMAYEKEQADIAYQQWLQEMAYQKEQDAIANQQWQDAFELEKAQWEWQKQQAGLKATQSSGGNPYIPDIIEEEKVSQAINKVSSNAASNYNPSGSVFASGLAAGLAGPTIAQNKGNTTTEEDSWAVKEAKRNGGSTVEGQLRYLEQMKVRGQISDSQLKKFAEELVGK